MRRTQIYLDEDQKAALRALAAEREATVSDLVRIAIDRLLSQEFTGSDWGERLDALQKRVQDRLGNVTDDQVETAFRRVRAKRRDLPHAS